jgi:hypothetical protein
MTLVAPDLQSERRRPMRLFKRRSEEKTELPCPRCKVMVPVGDDVCTVCGWDMLDQYHAPEPVPDEHERHAAS